MTQKSEYELRIIESCNMCGSPAASHRVLGRRLNTRQGFRPQRRVGIATTVARCTDCGLIYSNPMPVPKSIHQHYGTPPESYWKPEYFVVDPAYFRLQIEKFAVLYGKPIAGAGLKALDVGAGIGKGMISLTKAGFDSYGLEPSEPFRDRAINGMGIPPDRLELASVEVAQFDADTFDFINMNAVVEHLYDPAAMIKRALYWLKPGGLIYIEVPSSAYLVSHMMRWFYRLTGSDYVINLCPMHSPYHLYEFTARSFHQHAKANVYKVVHHEILEFKSYLPGPIGSTMSALMKATDTGMQVGVWLTK
jgi:2-polyprenyl-3-methyl-5-hydroxy-6-metoxy-1,4-benzoquinol methylase